MRPVDVWQRVSGGQFFDGRKQWLRLGMVSAGVMAPLFARWNDLRGAERASELLGEVESRLKNLSALAPSTYHDVRQQLTEVARHTGGRILTATGKGEVPKKRFSRASWLWLAGAGLGLAAAGVGTYILVRRRLQAPAEEPLFELPFPAPETSPNGGRVPAATAVPTRPLVEQPSDEMLQQEEPGEQEIAGITPQEGVAPAEGAEPAEAPFIGDIKTMIYHESSAESLPAERNRVYFASEEDALDAGYHRDRDEVPSAGEA
jgi:hypothetical protein